MTENLQFSAAFYIWWVLLNDLIYFAEFWFLQNVAGIRKRRDIAGYVLLSSILTCSVMYFQSPGVYRVILHMGVILSFSILLLKMDWEDAICSIAIVFAMVTLMEGFQTFLMGWFVRRPMSPRRGIMVQMTVEAVLAVLLIISLFLISKSYFHIWQKNIPSDLYSRLSDQMKEQRGYLEEVKKKNEQYRAFQHDVDNHLLVLSGLIHEKRYTEAEEYSDKLQDISKEMAVSIDTGNSAANALLKEKIGFAIENGIRVEYDVHFSAKYFIEDTDLCILLANAMDNAIKACADGGQAEPWITVAAGMKRHFLIIKVVNSFASGAKSKPYETAERPYWGARGAVARGIRCGTGLNNIRRTVKKYRGTVEFEVEEDRFCIRMLLCLSPLTKGERPSAEDFLSNENHIRRIW